MTESPLINRFATRQSKMQFETFVRDDEAQTAIEAVRACSRLVRRQLDHGASAALRGVDDSLAQQDARVRRLQFGQHGHADSISASAVSRHSGGPTSIGVSSVLSILALESSLEISS